MALADVDSKQWRLLMDLIASLPPDLAADRPSWPGPAAPRVARKVTFTFLTRAQRADVARLYATGGGTSARVSTSRRTRSSDFASGPGSPNGNMDSTSLKGMRPKRCTPPARPPWPSPAATARPGVCGQPKAPGE